MKEKEPSRQIGRNAIFREIALSAGSGFGIAAGLTRISEGNISAGVVGISGSCILFFANRLLDQKNKL